MCAVEFDSGCGKQLISLNEDFTTFYYHFISASSDDRSTASNSTDHFICVAEQLMGCVGIQCHLLYLLQWKAYICQCFLGSDGKA
jgi:hypothetical protein